jgi:hypothetical protein
MPSSHRAFPPDASRSGLRYFLAIVAPLAKGQPTVRETAKFADSSAVWDLRAVEKMRGVSKKSTQSARRDDSAARLPGSRGKSQSRQARYDATSEGCLNNLYDDCLQR